MHKPQSQVRAFHKAFEFPTSPAEPRLRMEELRASLIGEEAIETMIALVGSVKAQALLQTLLVKVLQEQAQAKRSGESDLVESIDGCMDLLYVVYGTLETIGVDGEPFFDEVHRSNMAKAGGARRPDGKRLKPPGWMPPDIKGVLAPMRDAQSIKRAAVSVIVDSNGALLCVWNKRYNGWSVPGGLVEPGETLEEAQARELLEETGLKTISRELIFEGPTGLDHEPSRAGHAAVFFVGAEGVARECEEGCSVQWLSRETFLASSPFAPFYRDKVFPALDKAFNERYARAHASL